jgi:phosphate:Na+ symporter
MPAILTGDHTSLREIAKIDDAVDRLHGHIVTYLGEISQRSLTEQQTQQFLELMTAVNDLESVGDVIETDLVHLGHQRIDDKVTVSEATRGILADLHEMVSKTTELAIRSVTDNDPDAAREVVAMKSSINRLMNSAAMHQIKRLVAEEPNRLAAYTVEMDIIEKLKRTYYFAKRMAKTVVPEEDIMRVLA